MTTITKVPEKAQKMLRERSTRNLITDFLLTNYKSDPEIYTVRGWIMDELERRNPEAYSTWLDLWAPDEDLYELFGV